MVPRSSEESDYHQPGGNDTIVSQLAEQDNVPWYSKPNLRLLYLLMLPACLGVEMTRGYDASIMSGLQAVPSWLEYYHQPRSASLGLLASAYSLGGAAAVPIAPYVVDKIGRQRPILFASVVSVFGATLQGSSLNFAMFISSRFMLGFANMFSVVAASSLIGGREELSHPKERAVIGSIFSGLYDLGAIAAAAITLKTFAMASNLGWRFPSFVQAVPSLLQVSFIWFIPESPRWLISKGRGDEAHAILVKYHAEGDKSSDFVEAEYNQIEQTLAAEMKIARMSKMVMFSMPGMRKRIVVATFLGLFVQWCGIGLISNYLVVVLDGIGIHDNRTKNVINLARYAWSFINGAIIVLMAPRYPRRRMYLICTTSVFILFTALTVANAEYSLTHSKVAAHVVLALIFLYSVAYNLAFTALTYPFLVELFPFHARASGIAIFHWWISCAGFFSHFVDPIGINVAGWRWYIVYCVWNAFQVVFVYFVFPETSGRTLEELTFLYEDDREVPAHAEMEALQGRRGSESYGTMG